MGSSNRNTYAKALKHLKSTHEEVTYSMLGETAPTNNTSGMYRLEPDEIIIDPNGTDPVDFGEDPAAWEAMMQELLGDYVPYDGTDTSGLFEADGRIRTIEPPGDTSYVLGPMSAMWYAWGNFTQIGYVRQSDRRMVNLARITGQLGSWDGESDFTSYGQLTLEQAVWFRDTAKKDGADNDTPNYRAFYPGPPSNVADEYGRYLCVITGTSKPPAETVRTGDHGDSKDAGFPWFNVPDSKLTPEQKKKKKEYQEYLDKLMDKLPGTHTPEEEQALIDAGLDDFVKGGNTDSPLGNLALLGLTYAAVKGALAVGLGALGKILTGASIGSQVAPLVGNANNATDYNKQLAAKLTGSIISGVPAEIKLSPDAAVSQINSVDPKQFAELLTVGGTAPKPSANSTVNPENKGNLLTGGWGAQGGSTVHYDPVTDTLTITSEKMLRTTSGGNTVQTDGSGKITSFSDIPSPSPQVVNQIASDILKNPIIDAALGGLGNVMSPMTGGNSWDVIKNNPAALKEFQKNIATQANSIATGGVQGTASNAVALRTALTNIGVPQSEIEKVGGGFGQVFSQTSYSGDQIPPELRNIISSKTSVGEDKKIKRIIRGVKKPVVIKEAKQEKIKRRPRVIGSKSNSKTINSGLMRQAEVPTSFKRPEDRMWGKYEKMQNARASQERKNQVLDHLGGSDHAWEYLLERNASKRSIAGFFDKDGTPHTITRKEQVNKDTLLFIADENGKKESILQSDLNDKLDKEFNQELFAAYFVEQETMQADSDPLFKKVSRSLRKKIDYPDKPAKRGYPNEEPPKMVNGYHPKYAEENRYYNKLDPISANLMPPTGNKEIDAKVKKARKGRTGSGTGNLTGTENRSIINKSTD